jgi:hypothetical protein
MYKSILHLFIIINILIGLFIIFGGIISDKFAEFNIYVFIPTIIILHTILPFDLLMLPKEYIAKQCISYYDEDKDKTIIQVIEENSNIYIPGYIYNNIYNSYERFNPFDYHGLLILAYIINTYSLKYIWNKL